MLEPYDPRTEYLRDPMGMDEPHPRFSYRLRGTGARQKSFRLTVRSERGESVWNSGEVRSGRTLQIEYAGAPLQPFTRYFWNVVSTDETGQSASLPEDASFETGFMDCGWQAKWISAFPPFSENLRPPQRIFRTFIADAAPCRARLYLTALGVCSAAINGEEVTQDRFLPGWTDYRERVAYVAYDVTNLIRPGENTLSVVLADGWFNGRIGRGRNGGKDAYGPHNLLKAELRLSDGENVRVVASDDSFRAMNNSAAIRYSDIYAGESFDASYDDSLWRRPGPFNQAHSSPCTVLSAPPRIVWRSSPPIRERALLSPVSVRRRPGGSWLVDFGQLFAGRERFVLKNSDRGSVVTIRHAEVLNPDGSLYTESLRSADAMTVYVCGGRETEYYEPHFTYYGFRYLEVCGWPGELEPDMISGVVLSSLGECTGSFRCSDERLNQWHSNLVWTQRNNSFDVPTDCPQRDERLGWTGDAQLFMNTATYLFRAASFYSKWIHDLNASAARNSSGCFPIISPYFDDDLPYSSVWSDAGICAPLTMYRKYADTRLLEDGYPLMRHWLKTQENTASKPDSGIVDTSRYGDWLSAGPDTPHDFLATACLHGMSLTLAEIADRLGKTHDAADLRDRACRIKSAFQRRFFDQEGNLKIRTQTAALLALHHRLTDGVSTRKTLDFLEHDIRIGHGLHLTTGIVGTPLLLRTLTEFGKGELACSLLLQTTAPGWLNQVVLGATTVWERWDSFSPERGFADPAMNSFCHCGLGSAGEWLYEGLGGISPAPVGTDDGAFRRFRLKPCFTEQLAFVDVSFESECGGIVSEWKALYPGFEWKIVVPPNTSAEAEFPVPAEKVQCLASSGAYGTSCGRSIRLEPGEFVFRFQT